MIKLETEFEENADRTGVQTFRLVKRTNNTNGQPDVAIYQRIRQDGTTFAYEVFRIKVRKAGSKILDAVLQEDTESYGNVPRKNRFNNFSLYCCKTLERAEQVYSQLINDKIVEDDSTDEGESQTPPPDEKNSTGKAKRGRKAKTVKMTIPKKGERFTMKQLKLWTGEEQPLLYIRLQPMIEKGLVSIVGELREPNTRGRAQVVYMSNTNDYWQDMSSEITMN
jgi:hypothetical protein